MFFTRRTIDDALGEWIFENYFWAVRKHNTNPKWVEKPLILPNKTFFSSRRGNDQETAESIVTEIKDILGIANSNIKVEALPALPDEIAHEYGVMSSIGGEYYHDKTAPLITYDPRLLRTPIPFINTMAHELMHAKLSTHVDDMPGGDATHELATDLHCIIDGFGIFQLMAAEQSGWSGYMTQQSRAFALAIFLKSKKKSLDDLCSYLGKRSFKAVKKAMKELDYWHEEMNELDGLLS